MDKTLLTNRPSPLAPRHSPIATRPSPLITLLRYRFFLFAGLLPYLLGAAVAYRSETAFSLFYFLLGLLGLFFALVGVETFNEYFDAREGGDRIFIPESERAARPSHFLLGVAAFALACAVALYLTYRRGAAIMLFAGAGFVAAAFYVGPPLRLTYRGLGEVTIALAYGPFMTLGSYYLQTRKVASLPLFASIVPMLLLFSLAVVNEIPDYYGDMLVGKRNLVVRLGRRKTASIYRWSVSIAFLYIALGVITRLFPAVMIISFLALPLAIRSAAIASRRCESPARFIPAIRGAMAVYLFVLLVLIASYRTG